MIKFAAGAIVLAVTVAMLAPDRPSSVAAAGAGHGRVIANPQAPAANPIEAVGNGVGEIILDRAPDGHFYANTMVNGATVRMMVDTGASSVALNRADAQAAGIAFGNGDFTERGRGAGGVIALKPVTLDRVGIGPIEAHRVDGVVVDGALDVSLLGQSWLSRIGHVAIEGDRMILR